MIRVKRVQPGERIPIRLTDRERKLILDHSFIGGDLERRIRVAAADGPAVFSNASLVNRGRSACSYPAMIYLTSNSWAPTARRGLTRRWSGPPHERRALVRAPVGGGRSTPRR